MTITVTQRAEFLELCWRYYVDKMYMFGSFLTSHFSLDSDIDVMVKVDIEDPADRGDALLSLWDSLENSFGRKVDLLTDSSIRNLILRANIDRTKRLIYDRNGPTANPA